MPKTPVVFSNSEGVCVAPGCVYRTLHHHHIYRRNDRSKRYGQPCVCNEIGNFDIKTQDPALKHEVFTMGSVEEFTWSNEDDVNHPSHYTQYQGLEVIDLTEQMNFNRGNAVKYICRAGHKSTASEVTDLEKAAWYIQREIERIKNL